MSDSEDHHSADALPRGYALRPEWEVTPRQLQKLLAGDETIVLIDCRTAEERAVARIDGSVHLPMNVLVEHPDELDVDDGQRVVIHCHRGQRSLRVTAVLRQAGFENTWSLAGGIDAWSLSVDPSIARY